MKKEKCDDVSDLDGLIESATDLQHMKSYAIGHRDGLRDGRLDVNKITNRDDLYLKPCSLSDCPPGLFVFNGSVCFKSDYMNDVFCLNTGEFFWGGVTTNEERYGLIVTPIRPSYVDRVLLSSP